MKCLLCQLAVNPGEDFCRSCADELAAPLPLGARIGNTFPLRILSPRRERRWPSEPAGPGGETPRSIEREEP